MLILKLFDFVAGKVRLNSNVAPAQPEISSLPELFAPGKMLEGKVGEPIESSVEKCDCALPPADRQEESFEEPEFEEHNWLSKRSHRSRKLRVDDKGWTRSERRDERRRHRTNKDSCHLSKAERRALVVMGLYDEC